MLQELKEEHPGVLTLFEVIHAKDYLYMLSERLDLDLFDFYDDHPNGVTENLGRLIVMGIMEVSSCKQPTTNGETVCRRTCIHKSINQKRILTSSRAQKSSRGLTSYTGGISAIEI